MKKRKLILPSIALAVVAAFGLAACGGNKPAQSSGGNGGGSSQSQPAGDSSGQSLGEITITAAGNKTDLLVGETVQLTASVEGVTWKSRATTVATVDDKGLVTAVGAGSVKIRAEKDGYDTGSITINVSKAPEKEAHTVIDLEHADHYSPTDIWGMDLSAYGMGFMGPGDSPIEDNGGATEDGHSLGWLQQGCKETLTFTANKAAEVEIGISMAYNAEMNLASSLSVKFNNVAIDMTGKICEGPEDGDSNNYYDWHTTSFGKVNLVQGNNVLEIEMIGQGPNMDVFKIYSDDKALTITVVEPTAKPQIEVTPATAEIEVGDTVQLTTATEGVTYTSSAEAVATVSNTGLVTGVAMGKATITVEKEGMKKATVAITVKAKPVAGQIVLEAEEGTLGGSARVENSNSSSGGAHVGYLSADTSLTLTTTLEEAGEYEVSMLAYSNNVSDWSTYPNVTADELDLSSCMTFKINDVDVSLTGKVLPAGAWGTWVELSFGKINLVKGENKFEFVFTAQGPNIDCVKITDPNASVTPPEVEKYAVSFDANGGTGEMPAVEVEAGEYELPANGFTAPGTKVFAGWLVPGTNAWGQASETLKQPGEKITVSAAITLKASWKIQIQQTTAVDLTSAFHLECEDGKLAGGARTESNDTAHGKTTVGYMSAGASITLQFEASAAGSVKLVLLGHSANADWSNWQNPTYYDHALEETTSITVNEVAVDVTAKGFLAADGKTCTQVDLGDVAVVAGKNTIVVSALQQAPNFDAFAFVSASITISEVAAEPDPEGMIAPEFENGEFVRPEGKDETNALVVENNKKAHGGKSVGYVVAGSKITLKFNASAAGKVSLKLVGASGKSEFDMSTWTNKIVDQALADCVSIKLNDSALDLTGKVLPGNANSDYYNWQEVDFGEIDVQAGENVIVLEATAQGPNLDCFKIQGTASVVLSLPQA